MAQDASPGANLTALNRNRPLLDAHNCYPYEGKWKDRVGRALRSGFPVSIEQDLAWYVDPATGKGRVVVSHTPQPKGSEPTLEEDFFDQVKPVVERALAENRTSEWPLIVLHFDFKDNQPALLEAVWKVLGDYEPWLTTAVKTDRAEQMSPLAIRPLLVITEEADEQERVFYDRVQAGQKLRLFGSAHTHVPQGNSREETVRKLASTPPADLLTEAPSNYRRWWNNSWFEVEEGGQARAGEWTEADARRLRALVDYAHGRGFWVRFYTLDGFAPGEDQGWGKGYNFGSLQAVIPRWKAAVDAGVNFIATDQYEALTPYLQQEARELRPNSGAH